MTDALTPAVVDIDGVKYELLAWDFADAEAWGSRLLETFLAHSAAEDVVGMLKAMSGDTLREFAATARKYTVVLGRDEGGQPTRQHLEKIASAHLKGRLPTMLSLVREHFTREFLPFFMRALAVMTPPSADGAAKT